MPPQRYEEIKKSLLKSGKPENVAQRIAAATENKLRNKEGRPPARFHRPQGKK